MSDYTILFSNRKTVRITVERDRTVIVRAPVGTEPAKIAKIVEQKKEWIREKTKHAQKYRGLPHPPGKELVSGESMPYLGQDYKIELVDSDADDIRLDKLFLVPRKLAGTGREVFRSWYMERARETILPRTRQFASQLGVGFRQSVITDNQYRWGSCTPGDDVTLNWRLVKAPTFVIDYVIVHELAHLLEANHTPRFWNIVRTRVPKADLAMKWLRDHGEWLEQAL